MKYAHKIGAVLYILWGALHVVWGGFMLKLLSSDAPQGAVAMVGSALRADQLPETLNPVVTALLQQHNYNLVWVGFFAIAVAVYFNWKNSWHGYWYNLIVVSAIDLGFIFAIVVPGTILLKDGLPGPLLWVGAVVFSTIGILKNKRTA